MKFALAGAVCIVLFALVLELFRDPQKDEIRKKIASNQRLIDKTSKEKDLHNEYIRDLESIRPEVNAAVNGDDYDLKLMQAYFGHDAYYPENLKRRYDELYNKYKSALEENKKVYWALRHVNDSLLNVLE